VFLQKGIVAKLAQATNGLGVILEHRYYGESFPVANLSTESLRFLTTDQALADTAYFAKNIIFPGLEDKDLTASTTPYIAYGGSYAGAFVAFLRKIYPDIYWGAISSSGVTKAIHDYWEYFEAARRFAPEGCAVATEKLTNIVDNVLLGNDEIAKKELRGVFGLGNLTHDTDFALVLSRGIEGLQDTNWDPEVSSPCFSFYCANVTSQEILYPETVALNSTVRELLVVAGYKAEVDSLTIPMLNYIGYVNATAIANCTQTHDECFTRYNETFYAQDDISQQWRSWPYQFCTQYVSLSTHAWCVADNRPRWGYLATGSGVPDSHLPLISRLIDLEYTSLICQYAFNITSAPDVEAINKHGGFDFSYPRVAIIDGQADPWRAATPHRRGLPERTSTVSEPFLLIEAGVHHWDENGRFENETEIGLPPDTVRKCQQQEVEFVKKWLEMWRREKGRRKSYRDRAQFALLTSSR
jgi:Serine carboxypeptidase S28